MNRLFRIALTLAVAVGGAAAFTTLGVPAGALLGSTIAATGLAAAGLSPTVPTMLRNVGFTTIGATLGAGVTPNFFADVMRFPASLLALTVTMALIMLASSLVLRRAFHMNTETAVLGTSPGALSYALALASETRGSRADVAAVTTLQSLRLLLITIVLPPLIALVEGFAGTPTGPSLPATDIDLAPSIALIAVCAVAGMGLERLKVPAAALLAGILVSSSLHGVGLLEGRPAPALTFVGFSLAGAVIGSRFAGISWQSLRRIAVAGGVVTALAVSIAGAVSFAVARSLQLPFGQVWVSFAPGGVEGMSAMALTLGYDPVYVATHHIYRLLLLIVFLPLLMARLRGAAHER